jgi:Ca-activated chloride channel homolog
MFSSLRIPLAVVSAACLLLLAPADRAHAAGLLIAEGGFGGVLEVKEHEVHVTINNGIAVTEVKQVFLNTEDRIVEALYTFPVPEGASVSNFSMIIGGKEMVGEVVEKERARQIYESYKRKRVDPGLLEQIDYKTFEMRVFPIAAGAEQQVQVTYYQELGTDHDWSTYVYPLATVTRTDVSQRTTGKFALTFDIKSEIPLTKTESPSHGDDFVFAKHGENYTRASLETAGGDLNRDVVLAFRTERARTGFDIVTSKQSGEDGYLQLTLTAGKELEKLDRGMDYVFVLDVSGSMEFDGKLRLSQGSLAEFVKQLAPEDRFEMMAFNVAPRTLFNDLQAPEPEAVERAVAFLQEQKPRGGTQMRGALEVAYKYRDPDRTLNVVVLSDGMTDLRDQPMLLEMLGNRPEGTRVFCIGVGNEVNRPLLTQLAQQTGGLAAFLSEGDDFTRQAEAFRRKLVRPAVSNLSIDFENGSVYDIRPEELPSLFHGAPLRIYARYRSGGPVSVTLRGTAAGQTFEQATKIELPDVDLNNPEIERMWAWHAVQGLMAEARRSGTDRQVKDQIVSLCEEYSIVSEYASFIVLENDAEYRRWKIQRRNNNRIARDRQAREGLRKQLEQMRQDSVANIGPKRPAEDGQLAAADADRPIQPQATRPESAPDQVASPRVEPRPTEERRNGFDLKLPSGGGEQAGNRSGGGGGGGAIDPVTGLLAAAFAGASALAARRRRKQEHL